MPYVDLHRRKWEQRRQNPRERTGLWHSIRTNPFVLVAVGFAFGVTASGIAPIFASGEYTLLTLFVTLIFLSLIGVIVWQLLQDEPADTTTKLGGEKQLLMAIQRSGGSITPIEAALETSLTVDEADEILGRFASRGHLRVESRDGSLYYALPEHRVANASG